MVSMIVLASAFGATEEEVHKEVERRYRRELPEEGVCQARPELPGEFGLETVVIGTRRGAAGCVLAGLVVEGAWASVESGMVAAGGEGFSMLEGKAKEASAIAWTEKVLLAFEQPLGGATASSRSGAVTVTAPFIRKGPELGQAFEGKAVVTFDREGKAGKVARTDPKQWRTTLVTRAVKAKGVTEAQVLAGMESQGSKIHGCYHRYWATDLTATPKVVLSFGISGGASERITMASKEHAALSHCLAQGIGQVAWDKELSGQVEWVFSSTRAER